MGSSLVYLVTILLCINYAKSEVRFEIINTEPGTIWIGIQGNHGHPHLSGGGFILNRGQRKTVRAPDNWAGRFWARTWCDSRSKHCLTGDCGNKLECHGAGGVPPVTLVEIALKQWAGLDYYDISLVDGYNVRAFIEPVGGHRNEVLGGHYSCTRAKCLSDVNARCPEVLKVKHQGRTISCNSACNKFNTDQYCCRGRFNRKETCKSRTWPVNYPAYFKKQCSDAYSYAYDDDKSTFTCKASHYRIQFGP
ncbi:uncharacterized protein LOC126745836 [Anthonomus grandis grandis]|uniref:uncharacterized protein LOC126745836 n=1 Tax=Anthonomus grandis grandis TaxID=2921223 RepID=UPI0021658938|nr:uncharacterized protein LOC126745836 [Anthonomus grandis grandis]